MSSSSTDTSHPETLHSAGSTKTSSPAQRGGRSRTKPKQTSHSKPPKQQESRTPTKAQADRYMDAWNDPWWTRAIQNDRVSAHLDDFVDAPIGTIPSLEFWTEKAQADHTRGWEGPREGLGLARFESDAAWGERRREGRTGTDGPVSGGQWLNLPDSFFVHGEASSSMRQKPTPVPASKSGTAPSEQAERAERARLAAQPRTPSKRITAASTWASMSSSRMPDNIYSVGPPKNQTEKPLVPLWERLMEEKRGAEESERPYRPIPLYSDWTPRMVTDAWRTVVLQSRDTVQAEVSNRIEPSVGEE